ncbi:MAG: hypothetical protein WC490_00425 [Candidatus Margulisiibacteriota bacterium]
MGEYITIVYGGRELRFRDPNQDGKVSARELPQSQLRERLLAGKAPNFDVAISAQVLGSMLNEVPSIDVVTSDGNSHTLYRINLSDHESSCKYMISLEDAAFVRLVEEEFKGSGKGWEEYEKLLGEKDRARLERFYDIRKQISRNMAMTQEREFFLFDGVLELLTQGRTRLGENNGEYIYQEGANQKMAERLRGLSRDVDGYLKINLDKALEEKMRMMRTEDRKIIGLIRSMLPEGIREKMHTKELLGIINDEAFFERVQRGLVAAFPGKTPAARDAIYAFLDIVMEARANALERSESYWVINIELSKTPQYQVFREEYLKVVLAGYLEVEGVGGEDAKRIWGWLRDSGYIDDRGVLRPKFYDEIKEDKEGFLQKLAGIPGLNLTEAQKSLILEILLDPTGQRTLIDSQNRYRAALAAYKKEHVGPMVQRAEQVLRTHGLIGSMNRDTSTVVSSLNDLLVMANDKQREGKIPGIRRFCFLIKDRAELNPKPDGSKSDIVQIAEASASALGVPVDSVEYIVAPGVIESSCGSCHTADEKASGHYVAVELACDASDPDDIVVNAVWKNVGLSLYSAMFPWKNTEDLDPLELMLGGDFSKLILGQNASEGRPPMAGYIDRAPAELGSRVTHLVEHKLYSLTKPEFSYILGLIFNRTKGKVDLRAETELLWELAVKARDKAGSEEMLGESLAAVLAEAGASGHVKRAFDVILANLSEELPLYEQTRIGILPSVMGTERYRRSTLDTIVERVRQHNSVVVNGRRLTDQDFDRFDKLKEEAEKRSYLSVLSSAEPIRTVKISVGRDGKPLQEVRQFRAADVMRRAFYSYWRDRVSSPRFFSGDLCRVMNELDKAGLEPSEKEVFDLSEQDWIGRIEQMLLRSAQEGGQSPDEESLKLIKSKAESIGGSIYKAILESKINALLRYVPQDSFEEQALQKIRALVIREKTA